VPSGSAPSSDGAARAFRWELVVLAAAGVAFALALIGTTKYGIGETPDAAPYLSAAENIAKGDGAVVYTGAPLVLWPPLYPTVIAVVSWVPGVDATLAARIIQALLYASAVGLAGWLLARHVRTPIVRLIGLVAVLATSTLFLSSTFVASEPLLLVAGVGLVLVLERYQSRPSSLLALGAGAIGATAWMSRYAGLAFALAGGLVVLVTVLRVRRRVGDVFLYAAASAVVPLLWLLRNHDVSGTFTGERFQTDLGPVDNVRDAARDTSTWLLPDSVPTGLRVAALAAIVALTIVIIVWHGRRRPEEGEARGPLLPIVSCLVLYVIGILGSASTIAIDPLNVRFFLPVLPLAVVLVARALDTWLVDTGVRTTAARAVALLAMLWLLVPLTATIDDLRSSIRDGPGGDENGVELASANFTSAYWQDSELVADLRADPPDGVLFSNEPDGTWLLTDVASEESPRRTVYSTSSEPTEDLQDFVELVDEGAPVKLIWWDGLEESRPYLWDLREIGRFVELEPLIRADDGTVYAVRPDRGGPGS